VGKYASLGLDSANQPHIGYHDSTNGDVKYAHWDGTSWSVEIVDGSAPSSAIKVYLPIIWKGPTN
jgi:hypothetical protein